MKTWTDPLPRTSTERASERRTLTLPARLMWKDQRGTTRFASVVTRDVSENGVYVECKSAFAIPLYRLVQFQLERETRAADPVPDALRHGRVLSAVYRVTPADALRCSAGSRPAFDGRSEAAARRGRRGSRNGLGGPSEGGLSHRPH